MDDARLTSVRLVRAINFSLLAILVLLLLSLFVKVQIIGWQPKKDALASLPPTLLWHNACYKKIASPTAIPKSVLEQLPFLGEFSSFELLLSPSGQNFVVLAALPAGWDANKLEKELKADLAVLYPKKQDLILPDNTKIQELIYSPASLKNQPLPSDGLNLIKPKGAMPWLWSFKGNMGIITNKPDMAFSLYLSQNLLECE